MPKVELPPGKTDTDYVLGLLRSKGVLTASTARDSAPPLEDGFFRIVFLASPHELSAIYDDVARLHRRASEPRSLIRYGLRRLRDHASIALWALYLVRGPLLLLYVCALFATGLAPLVRWIERQRSWRSARRRLPRAGGDPRHLRHRARHPRRDRLSRCFRQWCGSRSSSGRSCPTASISVSGGWPRGA